MFYNSLLPTTSYNPAGMNLRRKPEKGFALQIHTCLGISDESNECLVVLLVVIGEHD